MRHAPVVKIGLGFLCLLAFSVGCESKFSESSPSSVDIKGKTLKERLAEKNKIDARIDEVQNSAEKIKRIIEMFKKVQSPTEKEDVYTPIDFLIDANNELKAKMPEIKDGKLIRYGKITLPIDSLSEECRTVETLLNASALSDDSIAQSEKQNNSGEKLTYSLKTCGSKDKYLDAIEARWVGSSFEFKLINKNLETIFNNILIAESLKTSTCKIKHTENRILDSISCENFVVKISKSEIAHVNMMNFSNSDEVRFEASAVITENEKPKAYSEIKILQNGDVKFDLKNSEGMKINN